MLVLLLLVLFVCSCFSFSTTKPNFIFVLTDDQDLLLDSIEVMPTVHKRIINEGLTFNNAYVATPICCPSRTETLSGKYMQNIGAPNGTCMNVDATGETFSPTSMFPLFQSNGYLTGMFGKLTNRVTQWCSDNPPMLYGFDRIYAMCKQSNYYCDEYFDKYMNGTYILTNYSKVMSQNYYQTALIGNKSIEWLEEISTMDKPFLIWIGPHSPHEPATPAAWYGNKFNNLTSPKTINYNLSSPDKHWMVAASPPLNDTAEYLIDNLYRDRLRSLVSVDDLINELFNKILDKYNLLNNTYIIFTSDHGFHLGQWTIACYKAQMYETDIHVPFYMRGPKIPFNTSTDNLIGNVDIYPTLLELANIDIPKVVDGKSFAGTIIAPQKKQQQNEWRTEFLVQFIAPGTKHCFGMCNIWFPDFSSNTSAYYPGKIDNPPCGPHGMVEPWWYVDDNISNNWRALRIMNSTMNIVYTEFVNQSWTEYDFENPNFYEMYDLNSDPYQMYNIYSNLTQNDKNYFHNMVMNLGSCKGSLCP